VNVQRRCQPVEHHGIAQLRSKRRAVLGRAFGDRNRAAAPPTCTRVEDPARIFDKREGLPASLAALRIAPMTSAAVFGLAGSTVACIVPCARADRWRALTYSKLEPR
jgi:hypothetical protein